MALLSRRSSRWPWQSTKKKYSQALRLLGRQCSPPTGHDRTSLMFSVVDRVGALYNSLVAFRRYRINMTKIESRPSKRKAWDYIFFVDCEGHLEDRRLTQAIAMLSEHCSYVKVLGSYPDSE